MKMHARHQDYCIIRECNFNAFLSSFGSVKKFEELGEGVNFGTDYCK